MKAHFNLVSDAWIPARSLGGGYRLHSLRELLLESAQIADLECTPHVRVSLMRLLVCITQAALGAPEDAEGWDDFGGDWDAAIGSYLARPEVEAGFNLFGEGRRFLQADVTTQDVTPASKLMPHLATGNNPTPLDHDALRASRTFSPETLALSLLGFQCFYPPYGAGFKGRGPCGDGNMLHALPTLSPLRETILRLCLDAETIHQYFPEGGMGRPIWELDPTDSEHAKVLTTSYLGRLVPQHRNLRLLDDGSGFQMEKRSMEYAGSPAFREPTATVVEVARSPGSEPRLLPARLGRSLWRDLDAVVVTESSERDAGAPLVLQAHLPSPGEVQRIWVGGLITGLTAKILDTTESRFTVPYPLFTETGQKVYRGGVAFAERYAECISSALKRYGSSLKNEKPPVERAQGRFWHSLDQQVQILLDIVGDPTHSALGGKGFGEAGDSWSRVVREAAQRAYDVTCPRQTPRQYQAYVTGLRFLHPKPTKAKS